MKTQSFQQQVGCWPLTSWRTYRGSSCKGLLQEPLILLRLSWHRHQVGNIGVGVQEHFFQLTLSWLNLRTEEVPGPADHLHLPLLVPSLRQDYFQASYQTYTESQTQHTSTCPTPGCSLPVFTNSLGVLSQLGSEAQS